MCVDLFSKGNSKGFSECVALIFLMRVSQAGRMSAKNTLRWQGRDQTPESSRTSYAFLNKYFLSPEATASSSLRRK